MYYTSAPVDDRMVIAWYGHNGPAHSIFDFKRFRPGTDRRLSRVMEYDRQVEALKGQGCEVFTWSPHRWAGRRQAFYAGKFRGRKLCQNTQQ